MQFAEFVGPVPPTGRFLQQTFSRWSHSPVVHGPVVHIPVVHGPVVHGPVVHGPWSYGPMVPCSHGPVLPWSRAPMVPWSVFPYGVRRSISGSSTMPRRIADAICLRQPASKDFPAFDRMRQVSAFDQNGGHFRGAQYLEPRAPHAAVGDAEAAHERALHLIGEQQALVLHAIGGARTVARANAFRVVGRGGAHRRDAIGFRALHTGGIGRKRIEMEADKQVRAPAVGQVRAHGQVRGKCPGRA